MGTRNLTMVVADNQIKVAQYGQWDGYPDGQGSTVLSFLSEQLNLKQFEAKVKECRWISDDEVEKAQKMSNSEAERTYPQFNRDHAALILQMIDKGTRILQDSSSFAADSLFCEWAYVVDFDKNTFEVYQGFNTSPLADGERFKHLEVTMKEGREYYPVKHIKTYSLDTLPTQQQFISDFKEEEVED